jgi:hypothetical protein
VRGSGLTNAEALIILLPITLELDIALELNIALAGAEAVDIALAEALLIGLPLCIIILSSCIFATVAWAKTTAMSKASRPATANLRMFPPSWSVRACCTQA